MEKFGLSHLAHNQEVTGSNPVPATNKPINNYISFMKKKIGKISAIKHDYSDAKIKTMQNQLMKQGYSRVPGTGVFKTPYKENDERYRTGLDENAGYIMRIKDDAAREAEKKRVSDLRKDLEAKLNLDLSPTSEFWRFKGADKGKMIKLMDGDNIFDLSDPWKALIYAWLRVHPTIASSMQAYLRGEFPADTQFYVNDENVETEITFKKKQAINKAIVKLDEMSPSKRKQVARVMGIPVSEDSKEEHVYNLIDNHIKQTEIKSGKFQGMSPVELFTRFAELDEKSLTVKDLIKQAITHSIYRVKATGRIYQGDVEVAVDEDELFKFFMNDDHQEELMVLTDNIKSKRLAAI